MISILVVEDNQDFNEIICSYLKKNDFKVRGALNPVQAFDLMEQEVFDLIISDVMMPEMDGFLFAKEIRDINENIPILFLTALDDISSKQKGYNVGIDDYMVKPINNEELLLRINALLKRAKIANKQKLELGAFFMDMKEMDAYYKDTKLDLSVKEFNILFKLLSYPKIIFSRMQLMDEFWGMDSESTPRTVDVYITKIREKCQGINEFEIETVHGLGYKAIIREDVNNEK